MQPSSSAQALQQLTTYRTGRKNPYDILAEQKKKLGVDDVNGRVGKLRTSIINTENLLEGVDDSVTGRTSGTLTTDAARSRIVNLERQPVAKTLATQQSGLSAEQANLEAITNQAMQGAQLQYQGDSDQETFLSNLYNTLFGKEQADEERRRYEQDRADKLAEAERQRKAAASLAWAQSGGGGGGGSTAAGGGATDPLQQAAYNDVRTRVATNNDSALKSDFNATLISAMKGNKKDQLKIDLYKQLRPDLFPANSGTYSAPKFGGTSNGPMKLVDIPTSVSNKNGGLPQFNMFNPNSKPLNQTPKQQVWVGTY